MKFHAVQNSATRLETMHRTFEALALLLEDGADGVDQDPAAALTWHLAAAEKGNAVWLALRSL